MRGLGRHSYKYDAARHLSDVQIQISEGVAKRDKVEVQPGRCRIYYIHRGAPGDVKAVPGSAIRNIERGFLVLEGTSRMCISLITG